MLKNTGGQKIGVFAYTAATGIAKTGDAANITAHLSLDFGAAAQSNDVNPTELNATYMAGWYVFELTQAETNAEVLILSASSATAGVVVDQVQVFTQDASIASRATLTEIIAGISEGGHDLQEMLRILLAHAVGLANGGNTTTLRFRDQADTKDRIVMTVDADGNRSAVALDGS